MPVADAALALRQGAEHQEAVRVGEPLEEIGDILGLRRHDLAERLLIFIIHVFMIL
jgi:hypothetical protein